MPDNDDRMSRGSEPTPWVDLSTAGVQVVQSPSAPLRMLSFEERYEAQRELGKGGMGAVLSCQDQQIGRSVAMKQLRREKQAATGDVNRFIREARVQAQLEHPSIVPVYELGRDPQGNVFFTMKRVRGVTLRDVIAKLREQDPGFMARFGRRRLLTAFSSVCLAVAFAHRCGVIHRDLKPSNIMLGEFGEVYILDWGVAKIAGVDEAGSEALADRDEDQTVPGSLMGTPGYMSPEQAAGRGNLAGPQSDVYSLGTILFELLTLTRLHEGHDSAARLQSTLAGVHASAIERAPQRNIAPELDVICMRATAIDPKQRYEGPRELHEAIEHFLDGERDEALRTSMAQRHADAARTAASRAQAMGGRLEERKAALRQVGTALALDPANPDAFEVMVDLLSTPPDDMPAEVERKLGKEDERRRAWIGRLAAVAYLSMVAYWPLLHWSGIRRPELVALFYGLVLATSVFCLFVGFSRRPRLAWVMFSMVASNAAMAATAVFFGPLVLAPASIAVNVAAYASIVPPAHRRWSTAVGIAGIGLPLLLEMTGVIDPSYSFSTDGMLVHARAIGLAGTGPLAVLAIGSIATILVGAITVGYTRDTLRKAEERLQLYSWHFRQVLPDRSALTLALGDATRSRS